MDSIRLFTFRVMVALVASAGGDVGLLEKKEVEEVELGIGSSGRADVNIVCNVYGV